ncbi:hypothetical protein BU26DRAFT_558955 [Trematosphaeria pertusa]|uniref:Uncharacterized protein n=1 Tax=Trematosphaeria pertusa TaxID=390896 RepID=A0A6A6IUL2_9PLEO|nr:uncharacterized protein BU26DRAFT_558955 [Trematosphaeria pertusa]KAF2254251.1 hypothetical protein BU26DRAFT_558955 [Trematosphaeria pertusa]
MSQSAPRRVPSIVEISHLIFDSRISAAQSAEANQETDQKPEDYQDWKPHLEASYLKIFKKIDEERGFFYEGFKQVAPAAITTCPQNESEWVACWTAFRELCSEYFKPRLEEEWNASEWVACWTAFWELCSEYFKPRLEEQKEPSGMKALLAKWCSGRKALLAKWCEMENENQMREGLKPKRPQEMRRDLFIDTIKKAFEKKLFEWGCLSWLFDEYIFFTLPRSKDLQYRIAFHEDNLYETADYAFDAPDDGLPPAAKVWLAPADGDHSQNTHDRMIFDRDIFALKKINGPSDSTLFGLQLGYIEVRPTDDNVFSPTKDSEEVHTEWSPTGIIVFLKINPDTTKSDGLFCIDLSAICDYKEGGDNTRAMLGLCEPRDESDGHNTGAGLPHDHEEGHVGTYKAYRVFTDDERIWVEEQ